MRPITAIAIVKRKNPRLNLKEIYSKQDAKEVKVEKDEVKVRVVIHADLVPISLVKGKYNPKDFLHA
jgi:hypothetical protein